MDLSAVCYCGISYSYSLTIFVIMESPVKDRVTVDMRITVIEN